MLRKNVSLPSLIALSVLFLLYLSVHFIDETGFAFVIFGITMIHIIWTLANKLFRSVPLGSSAHLCNLGMLTISCFALNRSMQIFADFTPWVYAVLLITFIVLLLDAFFEISSLIWQFVYGLTLGCGFFVSLYFTILLVPLYLVGVFGMIILGLGIHVFVPAILAISILFFLYRQRQHKPVLIGMMVSVLLTVTTMSVFFYNIGKANDVLATENVKEVTSEERTLPKWVYIAQQLPKNRWTEMLLLSDFKYELFDTWFMERGINTQTSLDDRGLHEPLLNIAKLMGVHKMELSDHDRLQLLKTIFNSRHETSRKLWSGEHLITAQCVTDVKLYPEYRLAYTQKTFFIKNTRHDEWSREEALYTLHLPQDAVVNSMSLWVNGKERKSRLTTKEKADSAYVQIVGVQSRDPALLHWQEGNRVSVTVFPCTASEARMLKVGYTTPLRANNEKLIYEDIFVEGPSFENCRHDIQVNGTTGTSSVRSTQLNFSSAPEALTAKFTGSQSWQLSCANVPLSSAAFSFQGNTYRVTPEKTQTHMLNQKNIVLDLNAAWHKSEYEKILAANRDKSFWYAADEQTLKPIGDNATEVWQMMHKRNFQLLPFHKIDANNTLIITKLFSNAPAYRDLDSSSYARQISGAVMKSLQPMYCLNIGEEEGNHLMHTLNDMNFLRINSMNVDQCLASLRTGQLTEPWSDQHSVNINDADINIEQTTADSIGDAPDHLMRLFAYKKILASSGKYFFEKSNNDNLKPIVNLANEAFIVTPVSSLIVLETDTDYQDMSIAANQKSLLNATKKGKGAIPEPHEWLMILLGTMVLLYFVAKQKKLVP